MHTFNAAKAAGGIKNTNMVPITVETDNPELFWQIWEDEENRGGGGGNREQVMGVTSGIVRVDNGDDSWDSQMSGTPFIYDNRKKQLYIGKPNTQHATLWEQLESEGIANLSSLSEDLQGDTPRFTQGVYSNNTASV